MANATKAKAWLKNFRPAYTHTGAPPIVQHYTVKTSETILMGDPLVLDTGEVAEGAATSPLLFGFAAEPSAGVAGDTIAVWVADRNTVFVVQGSGDISAKTYPFECDIVASGSYWIASIAASVEDVLRVLAPVPGDLTTDTTDPARVYCQVQRSSFDSLVAAR